VVSLYCSNQPDPCTYKSSNQRSNEETNVQSYKPYPCTVAATNLCRCHGDAFYITNNNYYRTN
jgi:hypothetical protein